MLPYWISESYNGAIDSYRLLLISAVKTQDKGYLPTQSRASELGFVRWSKIPSPMPSTTARMVRIIKRLPLRNRKTRSNIVKATTPTESDPQVGYLTRLALIQSDQVINSQSNFGWSVHLPIIINLSLLIANWSK